MVCPRRRAMSSAMCTVRTTSWSDIPFMPPTRKGPAKAGFYSWEASAKRANSSKSKICGETMISHILASSTG